MATLLSPRLASALWRLAGIYLLGAVLAAVTTDLVIGDGLDHLNNARWFWRGEDEAGRLGVLPWSQAMNRPRQGVQAMSKKHFSWLLAITVIVAILVLLVPGKTAKENLFESRKLLPDLAALRDRTWQPGAGSGPRVRP